MASRRGCHVLHSLAMAKRVPAHKGREAYHEYPLPNGFPKWLPEVRLDWSALTSPRREMLGTCHRWAGGLEVCSTPPPVVFLLALLLSETEGFPESSRTLS